MSAIHSRLQSICVAPPRCYKNFAVFPLLGPDLGEPDYIPLEEAVRTGAAAVTEVSEGGIVGQLSLMNRGDRAVFLLDGQELIGAKQNRVVNLSLLAPARSTTPIPVSCVEAHRWSYKSAEFSVASHGQDPVARASRARFATDQIRQSRGERFYSDQSAEWRHVDRIAERMSVQSATAAVAEVYASTEDRLARRVKAVEWQPEQVGAAFAVNGRLTGIEVFDRAETCRALLPVLLRGYGLHALSSEGQPSLSASAWTVEAAVTTLIRVDEITHPAVGEGDEVRLEGDDWLGSALVARSCAIHLSAFPRQLAEVN